MIDEEQIEKLVERLVDRMEKANAFFLKNIGQYIKEIKKLSPSKAYQLIQTLKYGGSFLEIEKELAKYSNMNIQDIDDIFKEYAKIDQSFYENFYKYRDIPFVPLEENKIILQQTQAIANITKQTMIGLTQTRAIGYSITDLENNIHFYTLRDTFERIMDEALLNISQGKETMAQSMRRIINDIGSSGLKTFNYESGRTMRVDSAIRMQLKDGLRQLHNENREVYAQEFKSDGVEVSVHLNPAPDHEEVQGHQFRNEEFKKFQEDMDSKDVNGKIFTADYNGRDRRAISQYNCYHYIFPIIIGVNKPQYSEEQLQKIIDNNNKGFDFDGKHYTNYEGTQLQRALETKIREQKDIQILAKASDDKDLILKSQDNITKLTRKYKELSEKSGLSTKMERLTVSGYKRMKIEKNTNSTNISPLPPLQKYQTIIANKSYNENVYKDMLNDYNKWYNTLDKKEIEDVLNKYDEHIQKTNNININTVTVKESNPLGEFINKKLGYDAKPELISEKDFWIDEDGEPVLTYHDTTVLDEKHWYRGIDGENAKQYIEEFKNGKFFAGEGYDANGTYVTNSHSEAISYTGKNDENLLYIIPKDNAKIVKYENITNLGSKISNQIDFNKYMNEEGELYINFTDKILMDNGYLASLFGYDIIDFEPIDVRKVILNRGAIKVVK